MYDILYPIIEHYIGAKVVNVDRREEVVSFRTLLGQGGTIERNFEGGWDLVIENEKIAEIEDALFSIFCEEKDQPPIDSYYKRLLDLKYETLNYRSNVLVDQLIQSIELLLLTSRVKLKGPISFGPFFIFSIEGEKEIIVLN